MFSTTDSLCADDEASSAGTAATGAPTASLEILVGGPYPEHRYGHTAVRVTTRHADHIYDYGRYGLTWGIAGSQGEGTLKVWLSMEAYMAEELSLGRQTTAFLYEVDEASANAVHQFFRARIAGKAAQSVSAGMHLFVIEDYHAMGPNCTTISMDAVKAAIPDIDHGWSRYQKGRGLSLVERGLVIAKGWPDRLFMPADLKKMLERSRARRPKRVRTFGNASVC